MLDPTHMPRPVTIAEPRRMNSVVVVLLMVSGLVGLLILGRLAWTLTEPVPIVSAEISPRDVARDFAVTAVPATFPPQLVMMAEAVTTALAPTPEPTATYTMLPTPRPLVCGRDSVMGELCEWVVTPTATPGPEICLTPVKGDSCVWQGWPRADVGAAR